MLAADDQYGQDGNWRLAQLNAGKAKLGRVDAAAGTGLRREGMAVDVVLDGTDALGRLAATRYDVVILDRDLPGVGGDDICRRLASDRSGSRVLMLTAADTIEDRVNGLSLGADDYLPKPFAFAELVARVRALGRRATPPLPPPSPAGTSPSTRPAGRRSAPASALSSAPRSSRSSNACSPRQAWSTGHGIGPHQLLAGSAAALALLIPIALAAGWFVAGRFLRPLRAITATARAISAGNLHQRLDLGEPADELTELGSILDDLFGRLEASFDAQRHFVANASHELRTPLAGLRTLLEVALADPGANVDTCARPARKPSSLAGTRSGSCRHSLPWRPVSAASPAGTISTSPRLVAGVLASRRDSTAERGIDLAEHLTPAVTAGDPRLIESLIANLIDNAIHHNHPDGHVEITTQTSGTQVILTVTNSGPVIPGDQIQRLFQPFQRLAADRNGRRDGYGLGLAIVNAVSHAHQATLSTSARPEGGLSITVQFAKASHPNLQHRGIATQD